MTSEIRMIRSSRIESLPKKKGYLYQNGTRNIGGKFFPKTPSAEESFKRPGPRYALGHHWSLHEGRISGAMPPKTQALDLSQLMIRSAKLNSIAAVYKAAREKFFQPLGGVKCAKG